jgi:hypothetical protein
MNAGIHKRIGEILISSNAGGEMAEMMYTHMNKCINNLKKQTVPNLEINNIV